MKGRYDTTANASVNTTFDQVLRQHWSRRQVVRGGLVAAGVALLGAPAFPLPGQRAEASTPLFAFQGLPVSQADQVIVPPGYTAQVLYAWGEPISDGPAFKPDASNTAADHMVQAGYAPRRHLLLPAPHGHGLLAINHEYTDDGLLYVGGMEPWTAEKVAKIPGGSWRVDH
jgi:secreted PhoX family phosphatase